MSATIIKNATLVNEGKIQQADLRIKNQRIDKIAAEICVGQHDQVVEANGYWLLPGMIDDQVHFREPGLTHKGTIASESRAAVAGGITSYMEMPNVNPATTTIEALERKFDIARQHSSANYSFYLGATENNVEQIKALDPTRVCGVKVFMGASTGTLLVEDPTALDKIFRDCPVLIATHCESGKTMDKNLNRITAKKGTQDIFDHPVIRDDEACYASSSYAVDLAKKNKTQLNVLHITTEKELGLFETGPVASKHITAEACVHHLWFCDEDYAQQGNLIKCNPAIKKRTDRDAILQALINGRIDIVATDHAPHTWDEKQQPYLTAPAGLPLVQHALLTMMDHVKTERLTIEQVVEKTAHNPAIRYGVQERGFLREGFFADLVLISPNETTRASHESSLYHCQWTPFNGHNFNTRIKGTWVNGTQVYDGCEVSSRIVSSRLSFIR